MTKWQVICWATKYENILTSAALLTITYEGKVFSEISRMLLILHSIQGTLKLTTFQHRLKMSVE